MARVLRQMTKTEYDNALQFVEVSIKSLIEVINMPTAEKEHIERAYGLIAEAVVTRARLTSMKGVNHD
jgi:hypothetical protein